MLLGAGFVAIVDDLAMRRTIGVIVLISALLQLAQRRSRTSQALEPRSATPRGALVVGTVAGFASMTANAGGPVASLYLLKAGFPVLNLLGTATWFFFAVNLTELPISAELNLISVDTRRIDAWMTPSLLCGAWAGARLIRVLSASQFETWPSSARAGPRSFSWLLIDLTIGYFAKKL